MREQTQNCKMAKCGEFICIYVMYLDPIIISLSLYIYIYMYVYVLPIGSMGVVYLPT